MNKAPKRPAGRQPEKVGSGGDAISGTVGNDAKGVVIGKNVFQSIVVIGTLKIPVLPVLVLIGLVLAAAAFFGVRLLGPAQMSGSFNLAVAEFGQLDASGRVASTQKGQSISKRLYEGLKIELDSLSPADRANFQPQVWQDSMDITQKRVKIGIIAGDTPQARWSAACALAQTIHAGVMIYGNLPADGNPAAFIPEFAICSDPGLRVNADEIVGTHQVIYGLPAALIQQMGRPDTDLAVNLRVNSWTSALSLFSIGIMYDLQGRSDLALGIFQKARDQMGSGADPTGEVLWFFIGREELILADSAGANAGNAQQRSAHLANAQAAFEQALKANPLYARAHIGLGGVDFDRAQATASTERLKNPDLAAAIQEYSKALAQAPDSPGALIETKARLGLVSTWILEGEAQRDLGQQPAAESSFSQAIQTASAALQPLIDAKQYRVLAQGYLSLGEAYHEQGHLKLLEGDTAASRDLFEKASANYAACIQQQDVAITDQTLANTIVAGLCVPNKKSVDASLAELKGQ
jgi:tetratricopeptide (TPR) repeat protein